MKKLLGIIIPVYNGSEYIEKAILSTELNINSECEVIVVDDCSTDDTVNICNQFKKHNNFRLITHESNKGVSASRNTGINASNSLYVSFLDSDDELVCGTVHRWISEIEDGNFDLHIWGCEVINEKTNQTYCPTKEMMLTRPGFIHNMFYYDISHQIRYGVLWGKVYKKELIEYNRFSFDENMNLGEDTFFNIDYYACIRNAFIHNDISYKHIQRKNSLSKQYCNNYPLLLNKTINKYRALFCNNGKSSISPFIMKKRIEAIVRKKRWQNQTEVRH